MCDRERCYVEMWAVFTTSNYYHLLPTSHLHKEKRNKETKRNKRNDVRSDKYHYMLFRTARNIEMKVLPLENIGDLHSFTFPWNPKHIAYISLYIY